MRRSVAVSLLAILGALLPAASVGAQEPQGAPLSSHLGVDATPLRAARYAYELTLTRDGMTQPLGSQTISFSGTTYAGTPSWLILEARSGPGISGLDSLIVTRDALVPLHWGASTGLARFAAEFARDSLYGATASPLGKRTLVGPAPRGAIASEGMLDGVMQLAPVEKGWSADAMLVVAEVGGTRLVAARLTVEREEDVTVPAGTFPSWVVCLRTGNGEKWLWVSKEYRMVVKSTQALAQLDGAVLDRVLTRVDDLTIIPPPAVPLPSDPRFPPARAGASQ